MATTSELMRRARQWVRANECPFPVDLFVEMMGAGLDVEQIERDLLYGQTNDDNQEDD